ncbi:Transposable element P transposase, partial [Stegodyphus mimosarum]
MMKTATEGKEDFQCLVVLSFDEMKIKTTYEYDTKHDQIIGPYSQMQMLLARGLFNNWKQPLFVDFDRRMTNAILFSVISKLHQIGYKVVAVVSDMSGSNHTLWKTLQINENKSWCMHPISSENIYFLADVPHLLKLICNWLLDTGFVLSDNSIISKTPLLELLKINAGEYEICCKLTETHILCKKSQRQNVSLASQLFSETTAVALERYKPGSDPKLCCDLAHFIKEVNNWFHIFNSYTPEIFGFPCKSAYGKYITTQDAAIDKFCKTVKNMRCIGKKSLQVFQKGVLISSTSLKSLLHYVKEKYNRSYILTSFKSRRSRKFIFAFKEQRRTR